MVGQILKQSVRIDDGTIAPVSDLVLSRLYRANKVEVEEIAAALPPEARARLAVFCFARAPLREAGRQIAWMCDPATLIRNGGARLAHALANFMTEWQPHSVGSHRPKVSLATAAHMRSRWFDEPGVGEESDNLAANDSPHSVNDTVQ